jgi:K(+)-stimulated pyrophosphate-energized sodium pump
MQLAALFLPMAMAGVGIGLSILGIYLVRTEEKADQKTLLKALGRGVDISSLLIIAAAFGLTLADGRPSSSWLRPAWSSVSLPVG